MASGNITVMVAGRNLSFVNKVDLSIHRSARRNYLKSKRSCGMDFESKCAKPKTSLLFTTPSICSGTSFMPWSCKIPITEGDIGHYGSYSRLNFPKSMASSNITVMVAGRNLPLVNKVNLSIHKSARRNYLKSKRSCGMDFELKCAKPKTSLLFTTPSLRSGTSFMPWSCKIPITEDDIAKQCLALVPRSYFPAMGAVSRQWRSFIQSKEFIMVRKLTGTLEEWLYVLTGDAEGKGKHWEILGCLGHDRQLLPVMPGPEKVKFGVVVLDGKLLILAGCFVDQETVHVSADVYQYDSCLNRWSTLTTMNVARYDFACAEVNGMVYAVGGYGSNGESLSSAEVYDPQKNEWMLIESLRRPRRGCFACGLEGKLYVMGGRSEFTIGNSKFVDVYNPKSHSWCEKRNGRVMVTAHAVLGKKLFCVEWKDQRKLAIFDSEDNSWKMVPIPLTGSSKVEFQFGIFDDKLLLFSSMGETGYKTLLYDPIAAPGSEWQTSAIKPPGMCFCSVTIKA